MAGFRYNLGLKLRHALSQLVEKQSAAGGLSADAALRLFKALAEVPVIGPGCHALAGAMHAAAGRDALAISHYESALAGSRSRDAGVHHRLGLARFRAKDPAGAEPSLRRAMELAPNDHWPCLALGDCLLALGRPEEAEQIFRKGLMLRPDERWVRQQLMDCLCLQGRYDEAIDHLIEAAAATESGSGPLSAPFPDYLLVYFPLASHPRAQALKAIVERHPEASEAMLFLALMETQLGRHAEAIARLEQVAALRWPNLGQPPGMTGEQGGAPKPPSFLIIGQAKGGTTTLYDYLCEHPRFEPSLVKEPHFWSAYWAAGMEWYRAHFPPLPVGSELITGESSTSYFHYPDAARRIAAGLPGIKLILLLREPVTRAYSHYWMNIRRGSERREWEEVVEAELQSIPACPLEMEDVDRYWRPGRPGSYLLPSAALPHLQRWLSYFPPEQLLILRSSELAGDLPGTMCRVCAFLDLPPFVPAKPKRLNVGYYPLMAPAVEQRLRDWFAPHQQALENFLAHLQGESI